MNDIVIINIEKAKQLYMSGMSPINIARELNISKHAVASWIQEGKWTEKRTEVDQALIADLKQRKSKMIPQAIDMGINLILNSFKHRMDSGEPLTVMESKVVSSVISDIDKLIRLDAGDPTEIQGLSQTIPITLDELKKVVARDPFINTIELKEGVDYGPDTDKRESNEPSEQDRNRDIPIRRDPMAD